MAGGLGACPVVSMVSSNRTFSTDIRTWIREGHMGRNIFRKEVSPSIPFGTSCVTTL